MGTFTSTVSANPVLLRIIEQAAANSPFNVVVFSGERGGNASSAHHGGNAIDIVLIDPATGREIPNLGAGGESFNAYQSFANIARQTQMAIAPELADQFRWGGYFSPSGLNPSGADLMHFDLRPGGAMALGGWEGGLNAQGQQFVANLGAGQTYSASERTQGTDDGRIIPFPAPAAPIPGAGPATGAQIGPPAQITSIPAENPRQNALISAIESVGNALQPQNAVQPAVQRPQTPPMAADFATASGDRLRDMQNTLMPAVENVSTAVQPGELMFSDPEEVIPRQVDPFRPLFGPARNAPLKGGTRIRA